MYYEEEQFNPTFNNDIDEFHNNKNTIIDLKKMDKNFYRINRKINLNWVDGKYYNKVTIEMYVSNKYIRNAVTGIRYEDKVGSIYEDLYFKTALRNGEIGKEKGLLFYDSPEQFEKHQYMLVDTKVKERWNNKNLAMRLSLVKE